MHKAEIYGRELNDIRVNGGAAILDWRASRGITQQSLADWLDITRHELQSVEVGHREPYWVLMKLARHG